MIVVLTGAPGAGKGTQADLLVEKLGYRKISTGDALRKHVKIQSPIGKKVEEIMATGKLVSDEILFEVLTEELGSNSVEKILLDGYPRTLNQAKTLAAFDGQKVAKAVHLEVGNSELVKRLSGRRVCCDCGTSFHMEFSQPSKEGVCDKCSGALKQRKDDCEDKIAVRLKVYDEETKPVLDFYRENGLYVKVEGLGQTDDVYLRLQHVMDEL